jgi:NitT/TauT family transport system ATP-binding protein
MVRRDFAVERASEHERLLAALLEACAFCDQPENRPLLGEMLAQPHYVNVPPECIATGFEELTPRDPACLRVPESSVFHRHNANDPTDERAAWVVDLLYELMEERDVRTPLPGRAPIVKNVFRRDLFERAKAAMAHQAKTLRAEAESYQAGAA